MRASVERKLVDVVPGVFDPARDAEHGEDRAYDRELDEGGEPDKQQGDPDRGEHRDDARSGQVDLLADRRNVRIEGAHEM